MKNILPFALLLVFLVPAVADETLISYGAAGYRIEDIETTDVSVSLTSNGTLLAEFGDTVDWPSINFSGPWDLSHANYLHVDLTNHGDQALRLEVIVYDRRPHSWQEALAQRVYLTPGETKHVKLQLIHQPESAGELSLIGAKQIPLGFSSPEGIQTEQVLDIKVSKTQNGYVDVIEIGNFYLSGEYEAVDGKSLLPLIDRFGQYRHADWPGKVHSEEELRAVTDDELQELADSPDIPGYDRFGGWADGPQLKATGRFRTEKYEGKWYLVDPDGHLFFSLGLNAVEVAGSGTYTPITAESLEWFEELPSPNNWSKHGQFYNVRKIYSGGYSGRTEPGFSFLAWNLYRKYGNDWKEQAREITVKRLRSWGINTLGNWSEPEISSMNKVPFTAGFALAGSGARTLGGGSWKLGDVWDPWDPEFPVIVDRLVNNIKPLASSPWCIGLFVDNELYWDKGLATDVLKSSEDQPAKQKLIEVLKEQYSDIRSLNKAWRTDFADWSAMGKTKGYELNQAARADLDAFNEMVARAYYKTIRDSIHTQIPGCLYLGSRFARVSPSSFRAAAEYCDVVSLNIYRDSLYGYLPPDQVDAPLMVTEFHFGARDAGMWGGGLVEVESQDARAEAYVNFVESVLLDPRFVGCHWFEYYDQPVAGRSFNGENYNIGFVNSVDVPYVEMVEATRDLASYMYELRASQGETLQESASTQASEESCSQNE
ncbi:MAG: hypothetical protein Q7Q73_05645 [Verrucomicrobiota bacterium JB024]|nr:hypothetical protein [Verrucomicrobiota bacterium JB024]